MTLSPEACTPENVEALMRQLAQEEANANEALSRYNAVIAEVREAARAQVQEVSTMPWSEVVARIKLAMADHLADNAMLPSRMAELRKCYDASVRSSETSWKRAAAYYDVIDRLAKLAKKRDPKLVCYSGADILAIIRTLDGNPDA